MVSLLLFFLTIVLSVIFVRIGAIALELTGLPEEQASFQSLSAYSGVGYTTKEAEFILSHPERRKIIKVLILLGSMGVITTFATLGGTFLTSGSLHHSKSLFILTSAVVFFLLAYKASHRPAVSRLLKELISAVLLKGKLIERTHFEEILLNGNGYGIFQIEITENNPLAGKTLETARLKDSDVSVFYVNRFSETINNPPQNFEFREGDAVCLFGPVAAINDQCCVFKEKSPREKGTADDLLPLLSEAPDFSLPDQEGKELSLSSFKGKRSVILVFYPKDGSFFCTTQLRNLSDNLGRIRDLGGEVVAINPESSDSHAGFCDGSGLNFPLLSDLKKNVCRAYRALMLGGLLVDRTVYIIDRSGRVRYAQRGRPTLTELLNALLRIENESAPRLSASPFK